LRPPGPFGVDDQGTELLLSARRILVLGPCGAGKSTLSRKLAPALGLPLVHLDAEFWQPGWTPSPDAAWRARVEAICAAPEWLIEGTFVGTLPYRTSRADAAIVLDFPRHLCMTRVLRRVLRTRGRVREDMAPECPERLDLEFLRFVWRFDVDCRPAMFEAIDGLPTVVLKRPRDAERLLANLRR